MELKNVCFKVRQSGNELTRLLSVDLKWKKSNIFVMKFWNKLIYLDQWCSFHVISSVCACSCVYTGVCSGLKAVWSCGVCDYGTDVSSLLFSLAFTDSQSTDKPLYWFVREQVSWFLESLTVSSCESQVSLSGVNLVHTHAKLSKGSQETHSFLYFFSPIKTSSKFHSVLLITNKAFIIS